MEHISATDVGIGIAAIGSIAAAASARSSASSVDLSHRPLVVGFQDWDKTHLIHDEDTVTGSIAVRLRNDGPGVALSVRWRARSWTHDVDTYWSSQIESIPPNEERLEYTVFSVPPDVTDVEVGDAEPPPTDPSEGTHEPNYVHWYVETEFADLRGRVWKISRRAPYVPDLRVQRVRTRRYQLSRPQRVKRFG